MTIEIRPSKKSPPLKTYPPYETIPLRRIIQLAVLSEQDRVAAGPSTYGAKAHIVVEQPGKYYPEEGWAWGTTKCRPSAQMKLRRYPTDGEYLDMPCGLCFKAYK